MKDFIIKTIAKTVISIKGGGNLKIWCEIAILFENTPFCYKQYEKMSIVKLIRKVKHRQ